MMLGERSRAPKIPPHDTFRRGKPTQRESDQCLLAAGRGRKRYGVTDNADGLWGDAVF